MEEGGVKTGESASGRTFEVTVFTGPKSGLAFGSPSKPQHQQMPLHLLPAHHVPLGSEAPHSDPSKHKFVGSP